MTGWNQLRMDFITPDLVVMSERLCLGVMGEYRRIALGFNYFPYITQASGFNKRPALNLRFKI